MISTDSILLICLLTAVIAAIGSWYLSRTSLFLRPLDYPGPRSLHDHPVPRSGGIAILAAAALPIVAGGFAGLEQLHFHVITAAAIVTAVSFAEDLQKVPATVRILAHFLAAAVLLTGGLHFDLDILPGVQWAWTPWVGIPVAMIFVAWMINLYNFMDGIDGLAGGMGVIGFGSLAWLGHAADRPRFALVGAVIASACAGFLPFNWAPAKIFMGDLGSTLLGLMAAAMTLWAANKGIAPAWVVLLIFSPFIVDASVTLLRRIVANEHWWTAHNSHYYQRLVRLGWSHRQVSAAAYVLMLATASSSIFLMGSRAEAQYTAIASWSAIYIIIGALIAWAEKERPVRDEFLPFHLPDIGEAEIASVVESLRSGWLTTGPKTKQFEAEFAKHVGAKHAIAVNSCTAALHLALEAVGVREGDEVIVPTLTFAATAEVVAYFNAKPVLVDCRSHDLNMDPEAVARAITPRTKAIIPVHIGGSPCDMDPLLAVAKRHGLKVIEDAAHALPTRYKGRLVGTISDVTCFSFYATKTITTGEGGMVVTDDDALAERMRIMSLHGISKDAWKRYTAEGSWYYEILYPGFKYNMTDPAAALGVEQLKRSTDFWRIRSAHANLYTKGFQHLPEIECPVEPADGVHAWHLYAIRLRLDRLKIDRAAFIEQLKRSGIGTSVHFIPLHLHPYYRDTFGYTPESFPVANAAFGRLVSLPIYTRMSKADIGRVIEAVREIVLANRQ